MAVTKEYEQLVLSDLNRSTGLTHPRRASLPERLLVRKLNPARLHPNPDDEFCDPDIGPNYGIVNRYTEMYAQQKRDSSMVLFNEALTVEGHSPRAWGYMLLNGHHRWMAALRTQTKSVKVKVVNATRAEDIQKVMDRTKNTKCASFDLDEVVFAAAENAPREDRRKYLFACLFKPRLRQGIPALFTELRRMGFDIWVYTGSYLSDTYVNALLRAYHIRADGLINGMKRGGSRGRFSGQFAKKYSFTTHIDLHGITFVNIGTKDFDTAELKKAAPEWAAETIAEIRKRTDN